MAENEDDV